MYEAGNVHRLQGGYNVQVVVENAGPVQDGKRHVVDGRTCPAVDPQSVVVDVRVTILSPCSATRCERREKCELVSAVDQSSCEKKIVIVMIA